MATIYSSRKPASIAFCIRGRGYNMKTQLRLISIALLVNIPSGQSVADDSPILVAKPKKCVALRKGQICYQTIRVSFSTKHKGDYCIQLNNNEQPIKCWADSDRGRLSFEFESDESGQLRLLNKSGEILATSPITIAWVYKSRSRRRSSWRLF